MQRATNAEPRRLTGTPAAQRRFPQRRRLIAGVVTVERGSRRHDLVNAIKNVIAERDIHRTQLGFQLLHRPRPNNRCGHGWMRKREGQGEMNE